MGLALHRGIRCFGLSFSKRWKRGAVGREDAQERIGELVARRVHLPREKSAFQERISQGGQSCFQHRSELHKNSLWSAARATKIHHWESQFLRLTFRPRMRTGAQWVEYSSPSGKEISKTVQRLHQWEMHEPLL